MTQDISTQLANTNIGGSLQVGFLHFDDLKAEISSLTGLVTINSNLNVIGTATTNGLTVKGDATVSGALKSKTVETNSVVLHDSVTNDAYCVQMTNGQMVTTKGACQ